MSNTKSLRLKERRPLHQALLDRFLTHLKPGQWESITARTAKRQLSL